MSLGNGDMVLIVLIVCITIYCMWKRWLEYRA